MSKSTFVTIIAIAASLCLVHIATAEEPAVPPAHRRPNIVLIIADDLGWNDVGYHGSEIRTPRIDALAAQGVVFDRFCAFPTCTPKRVAILAGRSPLVLGMHGPLEPHDAGVSREEKMLAEILRAAGYQTFLAGKWHLGSNHVRDWPQSRGFDHFCGNLTGGIGYRDKIHAGHYDWQRGALPWWALAEHPPARSFWRAAVLTAHLARARDASTSLPRQERWSDVVF